MFWASWWSVALIALTLATRAAAAFVPSFSPKRATSAHREKVLREKFRSAVAMDCGQPGCLSCGPGEDASVAAKGGDGGELSTGVVATRKGGRKSGKKGGGCCPCCEEGCACCEGGCKCYH